MELQALETGGVIVLALGLLELVKMLINKKINNKKPDSLLSIEEKQQLKTLHDLHCRFDDDGAPLWYVPRSWGETQKKIAELLHDVANTQKDQTKILDRIVDKLGS